MRGSFLSIQTNGGDAGEKTVISSTTNLLEFEKGAGFKKSDDNPSPISKGGGQIIATTQSEDEDGFKADNDLDIKALR